MDEMRYDPPVPPPPGDPGPFRSEDQPRYWGSGALLTLVVVGLVVGFAVGAFAGSDPAPVAAAAPAGNVEPASAPEACLAAISTAEDIFDIAAEGFAAAQHGFEAAADFDTAGILAANGEMQTASEKIRGITSDWQQARDECRASA